MGSIRTDKALLQIGVLVALLSGPSATGLFYMIDIEGPPSTIFLPVIPGRIVPEHEISPGTFSISRPFSEVAQWGRDSIATVDVSEGKVRLRVWRPDLETTGVFQYSETLLPVKYRRDWLWSRTARVELQGNTVIAYPDLVKGITPLIATCMVFSTVVFLGSFVAVILFGSPMVYSAIFRRKTAPQG